VPSAKSREVQVSSCRWTINPGRMVPDKKLAIPGERTKSVLEQAGGTFVYVTPATTQPGGIIDHAHVVKL
jgi:hypothetical protein